MREALRNTHAERPSPAGQRLREIDLRAIQLLFGRAAGASRLKRLREAQRLEKEWRAGKLVYPAQPDPQQQSVLCAARLMLGDLSDWEGWQYRSEWASQLWLLNPYNFPRWDGRPTSRLLILSEQGIGDEVFFASCLPQVLNICGTGAVLLEADARLIPALRRSFGIDCIPWSCDPGDPERTRHVDFDRNDATAWIPQGDLPRLLKHAPGDFDGRPYLVADPVRVAEFERYRGWTGVSWRGRHGEYPWRTFAGDKVISLQYDMRADEAIARPDIDLKDDLEGVLALLSVLGRVVTVSTAVAHFACALGTDTRVVLAPPETSTVQRDRLNWRWGVGMHTPWYGSATVYQDLAQWRAADAARHP